MPATSAAALLSRQLSRRRRASLPRSRPKCWLRATSASTRGSMPTERKRWRTPLPPPLPLPMNLPSAPRVTTLLQITLTYNEMHERACAVAVALRKEWSLKPGDRVLLVYPPGLDLLIGFYGCQYAGVTAVPYYPPVIPVSAFPSAGAKNLYAEGLSKLRRIASSCSPALLLSSKMFLRVRPTSPVSRREPSWPRQPSRRASPRSPSTSSLVCTPHHRHAACPVVHRRSGSSRRFCGAIRTRGLPFPPRRPMICQGVARRQPTHPS